MNQDQDKILFPEVARLYVNYLGQLVVADDHFYINIDRVMYNPLFFCFFPFDEEKPTSNYNLN